MLGVMLVLFAEAHELAEAHWSTYRRRLGAPLLGRTARAAQGVDARAGLQRAARDADRDARCAGAARLPGLRGPGDRQQHQGRSGVAPGPGALRRAWRAVPLLPRRAVAGFKAGALNFALAHTAADAEIIAVIDSDYVVEPRWLHELTPDFDDQRVAIVQAPQDYRDADQIAFKAMCYAEYRGFFHIGMITRNERNAIIQHGTMTLVRKEPLARRPLGGMVHHRGRRARPAHVRGAATMRSTSRELRPRPDARHLHRLQEAALPLGLWRDADPQGARARAVPRGGPLSPGQRYHFVAGWLPWFADGSTCCSTSPRSAGRSAMVWAPQQSTRRW